MYNNNFFPSIFSDALYRLTFSLKLYEKSTWEASEPIIDMCKTKGSSDADCHNYVMVLQSYGNQLYACGTHAFNPLCSWRQVSQPKVKKFKSWFKSFLFEFMQFLGQSLQR